jgi:hypothetical protein
MKTTYEGTNVTLYMKSDLLGHIVKIECRSLTIKVGPCAQYTNAVHLEWIAKGQRRARETVMTYRPSALVLAGHGHPAPDSVWDESTRKDMGAVSTIQGRYRSQDPRWQGDFDARIAAHISGTKIAVVADYRSHVVV